jgi:hypothetical protein
MQDSVWRVSGGSIGLQNGHDMQIEKIAAVVVDEIWTDGLSGSNSGAGERARPDEPR